jgi:hypothetical protein
MKVLRREFLQRVGVVAAVCASVEAGSAQNYPTRPITMIVPFAAGGTTDVTARIVGEHMSRTLGQQIIVENIVGAGGTVGSTRAMRANPDGYTIEMGQMGTHAAAVALATDCGIGRHAGQRIHQSRFPAVLRPATFSRLRSHPKTGCSSARRWGKCFARITRPILGRSRDSIMHRPDPLALWV